MNGLTLHIRGDDGRDLVHQLGDGDVGTAQTIAAMRTIAHEFKAHPLVRTVAGTVATQATDAAGVRTVESTLAALFAWFKRRVRFKPDPARIERLQRPDELIREASANGQAAGDCDDASTLGASILLALGFRPVFITVARNAADNFAHVYWGVKLAGGVVVPLDPQEFDQVGQEAAGVARRRVWEV